VRRTVTNIADVETARLRQAGLVGASVRVGGMPVAPGCTVQVQDRAGVAADIDYWACRGVLVEGELPSWYRPRTPTQPSPPPPPPRAPPPPEEEGLLEESAPAQTALDTPVLPEVEEGDAPKEAEASPEDARRASRGKKSRR